MFEGANYSKGRIRPLKTSDSCGALIKDAGINDDGSWTCHLAHTDEQGGTILTNRDTNVKLLRYCTHPYIY